MKESYVKGLANQFDNKVGVKLPETIQDVKAYSSLLSVIEKMQARIDVKRKLLPSPGWHRHLHYFAGAIFPSEL